MALGSHERVETTNMPSSSSSNSSSITIAIVVNQLFVAVALALFVRYTGRTIYRGLCEELRQSLGLDVFLKLRTASKNLSPKLCGPKRP